MSTQPTPTELKALWQLHAADIGGIFDFALAVLAKWGQPAQAEEPVAVVVPCYTPSGKRVALCSAKQDLPIGTQLYTAPQPSPTAQSADSVQEDAARYRFLRDGEWRGTDLEPFIRLQLNTLWDAKIDDARAARGAAQAQDTREPLTDEQIQDLLLCGNPTDEEMRLIRIGWDAALGIKGGQHGTE